MKEVVSGMGPNSARTDKNLSQRVMRDAKIQNAPGGAYSERKSLTETATAVPTGTTGSAVSQQVQQPQIKPLDMFRQGSGILTDGAGFGTPGEKPNITNIGLTAPNPGLVLAAALYKVYPSPQTRMNLEAYYEDGIFY